MAIHTASLVHAFREAQHVGTKCLQSNDDCTVLPARTTPASFLDNHLLLFGEQFSTLAFGCDLKRARRRITARSSSATPFDCRLGTLNGQCWQSAMRTNRTRHPDRRGHSPCGCLTGTGMGKRGQPATPSGEIGKSSRLRLNNNPSQQSPAAGRCAYTSNHRAPSLSASAVVVARRFAAQSSRSDLRYRTRLPKRWKAGPSPLTR